MAIIVIAAAETLCTPAQAGGLSQVIKAIIEAGGRNADGVARGGAKKVDETSETVLRNSKEAADKPRLPDAERNKEADGGNIAGNFADNAVDPITEAAKSLTEHSDESNEEEAPNNAPR